jgi:hypothetical protein
VAEEGLRCARGAGRGDRGPERWIGYVAPEDQDEETQAQGVDPLPLHSE